MDILSVVDYAVHSMSNSDTNYCNHVHVVECLG